MIGDPAHAARQRDVFHSVRAEQGIGGDRRYVGECQLAGLGMTPGCIHLLQQPELEVVTQSDPQVILLGKHALVALDSLAQHQRQG